MTTFVSAFKNEIRRLARREAKAVAAPATKAVARYRREIARLKRQLSEQQKTIAQLASRQSQAHDNGKPEDGEDGHRFSARSVTPNDVAPDYPLPTMPSCSVFRQSRSTTGKLAKRVHARASSPHLSLCAAWENAKPNANWNP